MIEGEDFHQSFVDIFRKYRKKGRKEGREWSMRTSSRNKRVTGARGSAKLRAEAKEGG